MGERPPSSVCISLLSVQYINLTKPSAKKSLTSYFPLTGVKVSDYNGVSLSTLNSSVVQVNPDLPQSHELRGWYDAEGASAATSSLTQSGLRSDGMGGVSSANKSFGEVKKENLGMNSDKPEYYSNFGYVSLIPKDKALYQACANINEGKSCNKKVQDQGDGTYRLAFDRYFLVHFLFSFHF